MPSLQGTRSRRESVRPSVLRKDHVVEGPPAVRRCGADDPSTTTRPNGQCGWSRRRCCGWCSSCSSGRFRRGGLPANPVAPRGSTFGVWEHAGPGRVLAGHALGLERSLSVNHCAGCGQFSLGDWRVRVELTTGEQSKDVVPAWRRKETMTGRPAWSATRNRGPRWWAGRAQADVLRWSARQSRHSLLVSGPRGARRGRG